MWTREVGDGTDDDERLAIMGFDSRNNEGERSIVSEPSDYAKPLITPSGDRAVFSKLSDDGVYVVDWDGGNERRVASGFGLVVWRDPSNGREWVYVGSEQAGRDPPAYRLITRHLLDDPVDGRAGVGRATGQRQQFSAVARRPVRRRTLPMAGSRGGRSRRGYVASARERVLDRPRLR